MALTHHSSSMATKASAAAAIIGHAIGETSPDRKPANIVVNGPRTETGRPARADSSRQAAEDGSQTIVNGRFAPNLWHNQLTIAPASPPTPACTSTTSGASAIHSISASLRILV